MKGRTFITIFALTLISIGVVIGTTGLSKTGVHAQPAPTPTPYPTAPMTHVTNYGMQFIDHGRTGRLTLLNPQGRPGEIVPCIRTQIILDYYEAAAGDGSVRPEFVRRATREVELEGGDAVSFDFPALRGGSFVNITVRATPEAADPPDPIRERLTSTLAIREFGRTIFTLPAVQKGFDPQPDPPATVGY